MNRKGEIAAARLLADIHATEPPVPVEEVAQSLNVTVIREALEQDVSGILYREVEGPSIIAVNANHARVRQRFTVAHELGHLRLHTGRPVIVDHLVRARVNMRDQRSSLATSQEEIEANGFAAALLMPPEWISDDIESRSGTARQTVEALARRYDVSSQAMELRLINLGHRSAP